MISPTVLVVCGGVAAFLALAWTEWRRSDHRRLPLRLVASGLAVLALALLGLRPAWRVTRPAASGQTAPAVASVPLARPDVGFLRCPRELPLGTPLDLQGRVDGLPPGGTATLTLTAPDGSSTEAATSPAGTDGSAVWTLRGLALPAAGLFDWRLRLARGGTLSDDPLGVAVVRPILPRVLILETTPRFDTSALRRWFEQAGGTLAARTQIGKDLYRYFGPARADGSAPKEFPTVDGPLLAGYDLLLADGGSLLALGEPERAALRAAVADGGLGVLTLADDAVLPVPGVGPEKPPGAFPLPWQLRRVSSGETGPESADRSVRPRWPGMTQGIDSPVEAAPCEISLLPGQSPLVLDEQQRVLAAASPLGRGQFGLTLLRDTGRWNRANDPAAFAEYWSHLFSRVARRNAAGKWSLAGGESGPVRVDRELELVWQGAASPVPAMVIDPSGERASLPLIEDPQEPGRWRGEFWPRRAGWHRVSAPGNGGAEFDFYVAADGAWTALMAGRQETTPARAGTATGTAPIAEGWWFGLFLLGAGTLWMERRFAR